MSQELKPVLSEHTVQLKVEMNMEYELKITALITENDECTEIPLKQMNMKYY
jgi:hypothetical protein